MSPTIESLPLPDLPAPGQRVHLPTLHGSADALALATLAAGGQPLAIVVAQPYDATRLVEEALSDMGYRVRRNDPYAGGYVTRHYGRPRDGVHALQIEVARPLYMNEERIERLTMMAQGVR